MSEMHAVAVKFAGEKLATSTNEVSTNTLYRRPDGLYLIHIDEGDEAWLENGRGDGLEEWQVRRLFPELVGALEA